MNAPAMKYLDRRPKYEICLAAYEIRFAYEILSLRANMPVLLTQHSQKRATPLIALNIQSCQCGSKGAERLGRFKWGPGEEIEILPGRFFARFLRQKKAHPRIPGQSRCR